MISREFRLFLTALSFYTRIRVPAWVHQGQEELLSDAIRYLPIVGWITGALAAAIFMLGSFLFNHTIGLIFAMGGTILLTGAFHEDGFADVCDGFGGGWTKEKILLIMKDSRLGAYGATGLFLLLALKLAITDLLFAPARMSAVTVFGIFIIAHSLSRFAALLLTFCYSYARSAENKAGRAVEQQKPLNLVLAGGFTLIPLLGLMACQQVYTTAWIVLPAILIALYLGHYFKKWIGGYTGDCLGAVQQITEVVIYLSLFLLWKFI